MIFGKTNAAVPALVAVLFLGLSESAAQLVTIRFDANAPVSPIGSEAEYQAVIRIQDEQDPNSRLRLITEFLSGEYRDELVEVGVGENQLGGFNINQPFNSAITRNRNVGNVDAGGNAGGSEYTYLVLRMRFQTLYGEEEPERIIEAAEEALAAHEFFFNGKMGFIEEPDTIPEVPAFRLDFANQKSLYYQAMMESFQSLEDVDNILQYGAMALDAESETWALYTEQFDEIAPGFTLERDRHLARQTLLLGTMMGTYQFIDNLENELVYARRFLEVQPDDRQVLTRVSQVMAERQRIPQDGPARTEHLEAAEGYGRRAVDAVDLYVASADAADIEDLEKASMVSQANAALGMVQFQQGKFADAAVSYGRAAESIPDAQLYFLLGVAHTNDQNVDEAVSALARAVYLDFSQSQARQLLEVAYEVQTGSRDGLDEFIESEGEKLTAGP